MRLYLLDDGGIINGLVLLGHSLDLVSHATGSKAMRDGWARSEKVASWDLRWASYF